MAYTLNVKGVIVGEDAEAKTKTEKSMFMFDQHEPTSITITFQ